jgi:hypothetical protein
VGRRWVDRLLVAAAAVLVAVVAADALRGRGDQRPEPRRASPVAQLAAAAPPERVSLRGSPETAFLPRCPVRRLSLTVIRGPAVVLRYRGPFPCQLRLPQLEATVRERTGNLLYRGPALRPHALSGNLGNGAERSAPLMPGLLHCDVQAPIRLEVRGGGLAAHGVTRCRGTR